MIRPLWKIHLSVRHSSRETKGNFGHAAVQNTIHFRFWLRHEPPCESLSPHEQPLLLSNTYTISDLIYNQDLSASSAIPVKTVVYV